MGRANILLVDDQPANLLALEGMLQEPGHNLVRASSGAEALRWLLKEDFALVLLDVLMPGMDGFETAALIRSRDRSKYTPIIFLTAMNASETHVSRGYELGAVDYIFKPIVPEILKAKVSVFVELFRQARLVKRQAAALARTEETLRLELEATKRAEAALRQSEERYRRLFSSASDAIILVDPKEDAVVDANAAARALYGYTARELRRAQASGVFGLAPGWPPRLGRKALRRPQRRRDGTEFPAELSVAPFAAGGSELRMVLVRDVTARLRAEQVERLKQQESLQRAFVATVSHELRTPIAAIRGFSETLRAGALDDRVNRVKFIRIIESQAEKLGCLVEDLLTTAALESGKVKPEPKEIELKGFVAGCVESVAPLAAKRSLSIAVDVEERATVRADQGHLAQIMQNLLDNAIKYNRKGGRVEVIGRREGSLARVSVRDTGIGIDQADLPLLFQQFHRSENARAHAIGGTGLGLYIIKTIVESNGGRIWAESVRDQGSAFHFTLPAAAG